MKLRNIVVIAIFLVFFVGIVSYDLTLNTLPVAYANGSGGGSFPSVQKSNSSGDPTGASTQYTSNNSINDVSSSSDNVVIAESGGLLISTDNGNTYKNVGKNIGSSYSIKKAFVKGSSLWAFDGTTLYKSSDSGSTWTKSYSTNGYWSQEFKQIYFITDDLGWAITNGNTLYKTADSGRTWVEKKTNVKLMKFLDENNGFVVVHSGSYYDKGSLQKTSDSGNTWTDIKIDDSLYLRDIDYRNSLSILSTNLIIGTDQYRNKIIMTTDGGETWSSKAVNLDGSEQTINFISKTTGFLVISGSFGGVVLKTTDSGDSWEEIMTFTEGVPDFIIQSDKKAKIIIGNTIIKYDEEDPADRVAPIIIGYTPKSTNYKSIDMKISVNEKAECKYSENSDTPYSDMEKSFIVNEFEHSAKIDNIETGSYKYYVKCKDDEGNVNQDYNINIDAYIPPETIGKIPEYMELFNTEFVNSIRFVDTGIQSDSEWEKKIKKVVVAGDSVWAVTNKAVIKSEDDGNSWTRVTDKDYIEDLQFVDENTGFLILGSWWRDFKILKTSDKGANWNEIYDYYKENRHLRNIKFADENTGYSVYSNSLYKSIDGGVTWNKIETLPSGISVNEFQVFDTNTVILKIWRNKLIKTTDGGETWTEIEHELNYYDMMIINENTIIGTSSDGNDIILTEDFGNTWSKDSWKSSDKEVDVGSISNSISFLDSNTGLGKGTSVDYIQTHFLITLDRGKSWNKLFKTIDTFYSIRIDSKNAWIYDNKGALIKLDLSGLPEEKPVIPEPVEFPFEIDSRPRQANVVLINEDTGEEQTLGITGPINIELEPGKYTFRFTKEGYETIIATREFGEEGPGLGSTIYPTLLEKQTVIEPPIEPPAQQSEDLQLTAGWNFVSTPYKNFASSYDLSACDSVLMAFYEYDQVNGKFLPENSHEWVAGKGYLAYATSDCTISRTAETDMSFTVFDMASVPQGWSLIGSPYDTLDISGVSCIKHLYAYDPEHGYEPETKLELGEAYWIYADSECSLFYYDPTVGELPGSGTGSDGDGSRGNLPGDGGTELSPPV